ncbi:MAG: hypothetical protein PVH63_13655 [Balneolaceae bacterium]|jgi:hypothetical protein
MPQLPFDIPKSLASYAEHFEVDPIKATTRLKNQLKKRGPDAVGHFLLAWFYHLKGMNDQAIDEALRARIYAPGSPFFQKLHYYLSHPKSFDAWIPETQNTLAKRSTTAPREPGPVLNLDSLIQRLSEVESNRIQPKTGIQDKDVENEITTDNVDDIVSETLASIHEKQGKTDAAIRTYKRLKALNAQKEEYYNKQIDRLKKIRENNEE